jgi:DNA-binding FrmR family transcriptional regulator
MYKPKNEEERILHRLKIARGHLNKVVDMFEKGQHCIDVLHQSKAVQRALKETDDLMLEKHLNTCVTDAIKKGRQKEAISEVMNVFKRTDQ